MLFIKKIAIKFYNNYSFNFFINTIFLVLITVPNFIKELIINLKRVVVLRKSSIYEITKFPDYYSIVLVNKISNERIYAFQEVGDFIHFEILNHADIGYYTVLVIGQDGIFSYLELPSLSKPDNT